MPSSERAAGRCGCWAAVARGLRVACFRPPAEADGDRAAAAAGAAKGSHVHDAAETRYLNASCRELAGHFQTNLDDENGADASTEKKAPHKLLQFTFQELKSATLNFRPDSILGEGGFGYVFKGWIEPNSTAPAKPGTGVTVAVKSLKQDALQGHREWVEYNAKLSDFGLAKAGPQGDKTHVSTRVVGTYGYAAPEYVMTGFKRHGICFIQAPVISTCETSIDVNLQYLEM
ncbi:hypothetical protein EJB05_46007, partial [Eragrostis curvula]